MKWLKGLLKSNKSEKNQGTELPDGSVQTVGIVTSDPENKNRINHLKVLLSKSATRFTVGGFRPTNDVEESWIAKVTLFKENEEIPVDAKGKTMIPLGQFYIPAFPFIPKPVRGITVLTLFISDELPERFEPMGANWVIREYESIESLVKKEYCSSHSDLKPFPLKSDFLNKDYPLWDTEEIPEDVRDEILKLEDEGVIDSYFDIIEHSYNHKFGGYPSYCQSGIDFGEGFEFVFQISSDPKVGLNIVDSGTLLFAKNPESGEWKIYYDFY